MLLLAGRGSIIQGERKFTPTITLPLAHSPPVLPPNCAYRTHTHRLTNRCFKLGLGCDTNTTASASASASVRTNEVRTDPGWAGLAGLATTHTGSPALGWRVGGHT